jgi:TDG/mug DNA glycosylase family protein
LPKAIRSRPLVDDVLAPGLRVVFCGTALSRVSAQAMAYYAHPRNLFWPTLHAEGFTPGAHALQPADYARVLDFGFGLTDLCKFSSGNDNELPRNAFDADALRDKILRYQPAVLAFTSKTAGRAFCGRGAALGWQPMTVGATKLYVLPSTSPNARWQWQAHRGHWRVLATAIGARRQ